MSASVFLAGSKQAVRSPKDARSTDVSQLDGRQSAVTAVLVALLVVAACAGLFLEAYDAETQFAQNGYRGADLVSLTVVTPLLIGAAMGARRGSVRGRLLWLGGLGYLTYQYAYVFAYGWSRLFVVYLTLVSLSAFTLAEALIRFDPSAIGSALDRRIPARSVAAFLTFMGVALGAMELAQIVPTLFTGGEPQIVRDTAHPTSPVYVLDLGLIVPLMLLAGRWLRRGDPWGYVVAPILLVKGVAVGAGLLAANVFAVLDAGQTDGPLNLLWAAIALGSAGLLMQFLSRLDRRPSTRGAR